MPMRLGSTLWLSVLVAAVAHGSPILVDPTQSTVEIAVKATVGTFVARLDDFGGFAATASPAGRIETGVFHFNFASIKTGNAGRDRDMNAWQQTDKYPEVGFTLIALEPVAGGNPIARGRLRFHGVERLVRFPISVEAEDRTITLDGDVAIDTRDYGLPIIKSYLVLKVDPIVRVHFHLRAKLADS
jgi:polyisoprenoid-binding protein YceI